MRNLGIDGSVLSRTVVVDTQLHAFVKIHRTADHKSKLFYMFFRILLYVNLKKNPEYGGKDGMQTVINESNSTTNISNNHAAGNGKKRT